MHSAEKMDVITETSLEALLQRATDYRNKSTDTAAIDAFCGIIKKEPGGPFIASKLIASKIQSSEEWEALQGLIVLENCMKNCGSSFHSEVGKFRFLNEMIKLVSPKFLGPKTPESVRNQVLKMMHSWTLNYPKEHKIREAYDMLIKQGVIQKENIPFSDDSKLSILSQQHSSKESPIFQDEEKVKLLQKLLHSKNPDDLQAANRLIKTMVKEDEKRIELKSKRLSEMETIKNNVKLLSDMLESHLLNQSSNEELELIKELFDGCERLKPHLVRLASDTQDNDEFLNEVLAVSDDLDQVLEKYKGVFIYKESSLVNKNGKQSSSLLDLNTPLENFVPVTIESNKNCTDILCQPVLQSDLNFVSSLDGVSDNLEAEICNNKTINPLEMIFSSLNSQITSPEESLIKTLDHQYLEQKPKHMEKSSKQKALEELNILSETLLKQCKIDANLSIKTEETIKISGKENEDLNSELKTSAAPENNVNEAISNIDDNIPVHRNVNNLKESSSLMSKIDVKPLTDIYVSLESIKPSSVPPIKLIDEKGISVTIHMAKDTPREDVTVFVITTLNKNSSSMTNYLFQAVVPKECKIRLQPASSSELPAHNPFLPPSAITQIMLIANPNGIDIPLKCMISYLIEGETITEMGEIEKLPVIF